MSGELLEQFIVEGREQVQQAFDDLLALERNGADPARIDSAFRAIHTLKGSAGLFDAAPLQQALHAAEDLMSAWRDRREHVSAAAVAALLDCLGAADGWIDALAAAGRLPADAALRSRELVAALRLAAGVGALPAAAAPGARPEWVSALLERACAPDAQTAIRYVPSPDCFFLGDDPIALVQSVPELRALELGSREAWSLDDFDPFRCNLVITALSAQPADMVRAVFRLIPDQAEVVPVQETAAPASQDSFPAAEAGTRTLRIDAGRIDTLADLVGELFVAKNRLSHLAAEVASVAPGLGRSLAGSQAEIERLAGDMHRAVMGVRMTPLGHTLRRLPLLVRELAGRVGKEIRFSIEGAGTEADKTVVDGLFEPLLHVVRNAVDHGIEPASARAASGKPQAGQITLRAGREGEDVVISVTDDGVGIDPALLRRTARARSMLSAAAIDAMDDQAALDLVFLPGFSTAATVTDVSGRGVGMDAVRSAVHAIGGRVSIAGAPGVGTTVRFTVPQAVAVTTILVVHVGEERFGVPIDVVAELALVPRTAIVPIRAGAAFVLRDQTIPIVRLAELLGRGGGHAAADAKILVARAGGQRIGVEVDGLGARVEVILRPLSGLLAGMPGIRGAALLGDGRVLLVLDVPELVA